MPRLKFALALFRLRPFAASASSIALYFLCFEKPMKARTKERITPKIAAGKLLPIRVTKK